MMKSKYKVCGFCYLDPITNRTNIAALGLMDSESSENFKFLFERLKELIGEREVNFITDKDFTEIAVLKEVFPSARKLLCTWHVVKVGYLNMF